MSTKEFKLTERSRRSQKTERVRKKLRKSEGGIEERVKKDERKNRAADRASARMTPLR